MSSPAQDMLNDLAELVSLAIRDSTKADKDTADAIGLDVAMRMIELWGGQQLYVPKGTFLEASKMHVQIYQDWKGRNQRDLARKYDVSLQFIYRVIKVMRKADIARRQRDMFDTGSDQEV